MTKRIQGLKLLIILFFIVLIVNSCGKSTVDPVEENQNPTIANAVTAITLSEGFGTQVVNLASVFRDSDGDVLSLTAKSSEVTVVTVSILGPTLTITEVGIGTSNITISANDGNGGTVDTGFSVTVTGTANPAPAVSFASQVKPIIDTNCAVAGCHVAGTDRVSFTVFTNIQANSGGVKARTANGDMPRGGRSLNAEKKKLIADWVDQGAKDN